MLLIVLVLLDSLQQIVLIKHILVNILILLKLTVQIQQNIVGLKLKVKLEQLDLKVTKVKPEQKVILEKMVEE